MPSQEAITPNMTLEATMGEKLVFDLITLRWDLLTPSNHLDERQKEV